MTELLLLDAITNRLKNIFSGFTLMSKSGSLQEVKIFSGYMPQPQGITISDKKSGVQNYSNEDYESNFPALVAKIISSQDNEDFNNPPSIINVNILAGIFDTDINCQGYRDILNIFARIRENFLSDRVFDNKFRLAFPINSKILDENDSWPLYFGEMNFSFMAVRPQMNNFIYKPKKEVIF